MTTTKVEFNDTIAAFEEVEFVSRVMMVSEVGKKKEIDYPLGRFAVATWRPIDQ